MRIKVTTSPDCKTSFVDEAGNPYPLPGEDFAPITGGDPTESQLCDRIYEGPCVVDTLPCEEPASPLSCQKRGYVSLSVSYSTGSVDPPSESSSSGSSDSSSDSSSSSSISLSRSSSSVSLSSSVVSVVSGSPISP